MGFRRHWRRLVTPAKPRKERKANSNVYLPTKEEIEAATEAIRTKWSDKTRAKRRVYKPRDLTIPLAHDIRTSDTIDDYTDPTGDRST